MMMKKKRSVFSVRTHASALPNRRSKDGLEELCQVFRVKLHEKQGGGGKVSIGESMANSKLNKENAGNQYKHYSPRCQTPFEGSARCCSVCAPVENVQAAGMEMKKS